MPRKGLGQADVMCRGRRSSVSAGVCALLGLSVALGGCIEGYGAPPLPMPLHLSVTIDGHFSDQSQFRVFSGDRVSIVLRITVPKGASVNCLIVAMTGTAPGCGSLFPGSGEPLLDIFHHLPPGRHSFRTIWLATGTPGDLQTLFMSWQATPPAGTYWSDGEMSQDLAIISVVPTRKEERS